MIFYKQHPDDPKIFVGADGSIWRKVNDNHPERRQWLLRKTDTDKDGYKRCRIAGKAWYVHRLVYSLFLGDLLPNMVVCHLDGNPENNAVANLSQTTQRENISHKDIHGTAQKGDQHPRSVITNSQARQIAKALQTVPRNSVGNVKRGELVRISKELNVPYVAVTEMSRARPYFQEAV